MAVSEQLNVHYLDEPFKIEEMPLGNTIYVLDNYLESSLHKAVDIYMRNCSWQKSNQVNTQIKIEVDCLIILYGVVIFFMAMT